MDVTNRNANRLRVGITGHQVLSREAEAHVIEQIQALMGGFGPVVGVSSLAAGADQIFASAVLESGGDLLAIIPAEDYRDRFVDPAARAAFDHLLLAAESMVTLPFAQSSEEAYYEAGRQLVRHCDILLAVWDGQPARGKGGTADVVQLARDTGVEVNILWPAGHSRP